jgi:hypothetical protein
MGDPIWNDKGNQIGWVENGRDVFSVETMRKFATTRDGQLFSLQGEPLDFHLTNLDDRHVGQVAQPKAEARFKKVARQN